MKLRINSNYLILLIAMLFCSTLSADMVYLKNGKQINCKVYAQSKKSVSCRQASGQAITYAKKQIRRIKYGDFPNAEAENRRKAEARKKAEKLKREEKLRLAEEKRKKEEARLAAERRRNAERNTKKTPVTISRMGALWRSALLPGWGQVARGDTWRGIGLGSGALLATGGMISYKSSFDGAKSGYDESVLNALIISEISGLAGTLLNQTTVAQNQQTMQKAAQGFQASAVLLAGFYVYNLIDAWFFTSQGTTAIDSHTYNKQATGFTLYMNSDHIIQPKYANQNTILNPVWNKLNLAYVLRY